MPKSPLMAPILAFTALLFCTSNAMADPTSCSDSRILTAVSSTLVSKFHFPNSISIHNIRTIGGAAQFGRAECEAELLGDIHQVEIEVIRYTAGITDDARQVFVEVFPKFDTLPPLQTISCDSDGQMGFVSGPKLAGIEPAVSSWAFRYLSYFTTGSISVLAPKGWRCVGSYGSNGEGLVVTEKPQPINVLNRSSVDIGVQISHSNAETSGRFKVARVIARLFPNAKNFALSVINEDGGDPKDYPFGYFKDDVVEQKNEYVVDYTTPANIDGAGNKFSLVAKGGFPIHGTAMLVSDGLVFLTVKLPLELQSLIGPIIERTQWEYKDKLDYGGNIDALAVPQPSQANRTFENSGKLKSTVTDQSISELLLSNKLGDDLSATWNQQSKAVNLRLRWTMLGIWPQTDIRIQVIKIMKAAKLLLATFHEVETIKASIDAALKPKVDEFGNILEANRYSQMIGLSINASRLGKFPGSFDWDLYSVYAGNKFITNIDPRIKGAWEAEYNDEKRSGNFP